MAPKKKDEAAALAAAATAAAAPAAAPASAAAPAAAADKEKAAEKEKEKEDDSAADVPLDNATKNTVQKIPLLSIKAGPRDKKEWIERLKQELNALITV